MKIKKIFPFIISILIACTGSIFANSVRISQIDATTLLFNQKVKLYVHVMDNYGRSMTNLGSEAFAVFESADGINFDQIPALLEFKTYANYEAGINFLLLIDNSGSMYLDMNGVWTNFNARKRMTHAKNAVTAFLRSMTNPRDKVGLAVYNTSFTPFSGPIDNKIEVEKSLDNIKQPQGEEGFTEIYASIVQAVNEFKAIKGRKAMIVLSDGENMPYTLFTGKPHKNYGMKNFDYTESTKSCQMEGISVFAINFGRIGDKQDKNLYKIAYETGGAVFDAHNQDELKKIYVEIVNQILHEYYMTYRATMIPADKKFVKVECVSADGKGSSTRFYFSSTIFGLPLEEFNPLLLIPLLLALLAMFLLALLKFDKKVEEPMIEVLSPGTANPSTKKYTLNQKAKTIIGGGMDAHLTLTSKTRKVEDNHATIVFDDRKDKYTVFGQGQIRFNNKKVESKDLEAGDIITIGDSILLYNDYKKKE